MANPSAATVGGYITQLNSDMAYFAANSVALPDTGLTGVSASQVALQQEFQSPKLKQAIDALTRYQSDLTALGLS